MPNNYKAHTYQYKAHGEQNLWRACIRQHIQDLFVTFGSGKKKLKLQKEAQGFMFIDNEMFNIICEAAGYSPINLRNEIKKLYKIKIQNKESLFRRVYKDLM